MDAKMKKPKEALLVIDMLNDFCLEGAPLEVPGTREVIPNISREIKRAREEKAPPKPPGPPAAVGMGAVKKKVVVRRK